MAYIKKINIQDNIYDIYDASAIHSLEDIQGLGLEGAFIFKGVVAKVSDLPKTGNEVGYVYHVTENGNEYVWTTEGAWEEFGSHIVLEHTHDVSVSGNAQIAGTNTASAVSGSGSITVPTVSKTAKYAKVSATPTEGFVKSYPGVTSKMVTTSVTPAGAATSVVSSVTPTTGSIVGVSGSVVASKAKAGSAVAVAKAGSAVTVATRAGAKTTVGNANVGNDVTVATGLSGGSVVAGSSTSGTAYTASVDDGVLKFSPISVVVSVTPTAVTLPTANTTTIKPAVSSTTEIYGCGDTTDIIPAVANGNITPYTFDEVDVPVAAAAATTVITGVSTDSKNVATVGESVTLATGSLSSNGTGSEIMTGLGTPTTGSAITSAKLVAGTASDGLGVGDEVTISSESKTVSITGTAAAQIWSQTSGTVSASGTTNSVKQ